MLAAGFEDVGWGTRSQEMHKVLEARKSKEIRFSSRTFLEEMQLCWLILDFWSSELYENKCVLFEAIKFVAFSP